MGKMSELAVMAEEAGITEDVHGALMAYVALQPWDMANAVDRFEDAYRGRWESLDAYAHDQLWATDAAYRAACNESDTGRVRIDTVAWRSDYAWADGHVFRNL
ncbi:hypothetical protein [Kitasatospora purpeofusca]|uniref:hypothetical protein n=1 Tax=Kitasatospora purpeofusca TaxID=67352 RepID=UPI0036BBE177